jgi:hypothetical protein
MEELVDNWGVLGFVLCLLLLVLEDLLHSTLLKDFVDLLLWVLQLCHAQQLFLLNFQALIE